MCMEDPAVRDMDANAYRYWRTLLNAQCGIIDRFQAKQVGFSKRPIWHRLQSGRWQHVHEGGHAASTGAPPREARLWAALGRAGEGAILSHEAAAEVHGMIDRPAGQTMPITVP